MNPIKVKDCFIGEGRPKIIVPIVGKTGDEIISEAKNILMLPADVIEWRIDWYEDVTDVDKTIKLGQELMEILDKRPLLTTFRTKKEGGELDISSKDYKNLLESIAKNKATDMIDVEIFTGDDIVSEIISTCHDSGVVIIASNHDFYKTPDKDDIIERLKKMQDMGADIQKIAVMPASKKDVLTLLAATEEFSTNYAKGPVITMSMAGTGVISRLVGESMGSAMTFGAASKASAPGQINVMELKKVLDIIHESL